MKPQPWTIVVTRLEEAGIARKAFSAYLRRFAAQSSDLPAAELIFTELLSNALRFGYSTVEVAWNDDGNAALVIVDRGNQFIVTDALPEDPASERGRGLFLVQRLARKLTYSREGVGNRALAILPVDLKQT